MSEELDTAVIAEPEAETTAHLPGQSQQETGSVSKSERNLRLVRLAGAQGGFLLLSLCLFAAADSWTAITGLAFASLLGVVTGLLAGLTMTTVIHEWFHLLGARVSGGAYNIPAKVGLFVYDWNFDSNSVKQFYIMSVAGSVGGALSVYLLWNSVPADTLGRASLRGAAVGAFVYAAIIEWPVLLRTRSSGLPLVELSKIDKQVLTRALIGAVVSGVIMIYIFLD